MQGKGFAMADWPVAELAKKVRAKASWLTRFCPGLAGDVDGEMWVAIAERGEREPGFYTVVERPSEEPTYRTAHTPAYIVQHGAWAAQKWLRKVWLEDERTPVSLDCDWYRGGDVADILDDKSMASHPERWVMLKIAVEETFAKLEDDAVATGTLRGLLDGYRQTEIANELGVSNAAITYAKRRIGVAWQD